MNNKVSSLFIRFLGCVAFWVACR